MSDTGTVLPFRRAVTVRSMAFGLVGLLLMSGLASYHDSRCGSPLMIGNHMPGGAFSYGTIGKASYHQSVIISS